MKLMVLLKIPLQTQMKIAKVFEACLCLYLAYGGYKILSSKRNTHDAKVKIQKIKIQREKCQGPTLTCGSLLTRLRKRINAGTGESMGTGAMKNKSSRGNELVMLSQPSAQRIFDTWT